MPENSDMFLTFAILAVTILLFVFSKLRADMVAVLSLLALFLTGILTSQQALAGFADSTTIMVAALFIVGEGLARTGITARLGQFLMQRAGNSEMRLLVVLMIGAATLSAFMSNTGTVAMLMPAIVAAAWRIGGLPSRFLLPLAFSANVGGLLTLIGSPPNIVVSDTLAAAGEGSIGFFEFALLGAPVTVAFVLFMVLFGRRLLPGRQAGARPMDLEGAMEAMAESYHLPSKLFWLRVRVDSPLVGKTLAEAAFGRDYGVTVLVIDRPSAVEADETRMARRRSLARQQLERLQSSDELMPGADTMILAQDALLVKGNPQAIEQLAVSYQMGLQAIDPDKEHLTDLLLSQEIGVAEVILPQRSDYAGRTLAASQLAEKFDVQVLTVRRDDKVLPRKDTQLRFGDALLVRGKWSAIERLRRESRNFVVVGEPDALSKQVVHLTARSYIALAALLGMIVLMVFSIVPTVIAVLLAAVVMVLTGCLSMESAYRSINWQTVVLIAATLPLSTAMQVTGGAELLANTLVNTVGAMGPLALMAGVFLLTAGLSQVMSNTATTVLVAPIVLASALTLGVQPEAMMMMVAAGAASAFLTPIASPTNTLVFEAGGYSWGDYAKIGLPLLLLVLAVSLVVAPLVWPL
jgi:di/tricarboxylate transporter